jgi:hypothetical protein
LLVSIKDGEKDEANVDVLTGAFVRLEENLLFCHSKRAWTSFLIRQYNMLSV